MANEEQPYSGPLHLKSHLTQCEPELEKTIKQSVTHGVSIIRSIFCSCAPAHLTDLMKEEQSSGDPDRAKATSARRAKLKSHRTKRISRGSSARLQVAQENRTRPASGISDRRKSCRIFAVEINDEEGVVRGYCRRCRKLFVVFDRNLYWGLRRDHQSPPESWPYSCICGSHSFEVGVGFDYAEEPLDENDFHTVTIAVRCCACDAISMVLDEEG